MLNTNNIKESSVGKRWDQKSRIENCRCFLFLVYLNDVTSQIEELEVGQVRHKLHNTVVHLVL